MRIRASIWKDDGTGKLSFVGDGACLAYSPETRYCSGGIEPHVTLSFGEFKLHLNKEDFVKFAKGIVQEKQTYNILLDNRTYDSLSPDCRENK